MNYELMTEFQNAPGKNKIKGVPVEDDARQQLIITAKMPFIFKHYCRGAGCAFVATTIGSVILTKARDFGSGRRWAWDIGCGMNALRTSLTALDSSRKIWRNWW